MSEMFLSTAYDVIMRQACDASALPLHGARHDGGAGAALALRGDDGGAAAATDTGAGAGSGGAGARRPSFGMLRRRSRAASGGEPRRRNSSCSIM